MFVLKCKLARTSSSCQSSYYSSYSFYVFHNILHNWLRLSPRYSFWHKPSSVNLLCPLLPCFGASLCSGYYCRPDYRIQTTYRPCECSPLHGVILGRCPSGRPHHPPRLLRQRFKSNCQNSCQNWPLKLHSLRPITNTILYIPPNSTHLMTSLPSIITGVYYYTIITIINYYYLLLYILYIWGSL